MFKFSNQLVVFERLEGKLATTVFTNCGHQNGHTYVRLKASVNFINRSSLHFKLNFSVTLVPIVILAKFPHSPILHYACGSMGVVLCFATKKQQKQRIVSQRLYCFYHYFPLTMTCMHNEVWGCAEI